MRVGVLLPLVIFAGLPVAQSSVYLLSDVHVGKGFLHGFEHQAIVDPTQGRVNYVDEATALAQNLTFADHDTFIIRADSKTTLTPDGPGRNSVRIRSYKTYARHVAIFDIRHMPQGCATWPAVWEVREDGWPDYGEVDIVEGVNDIGPNQAALHTTDNCTMPAGAGPQSGTQGQLDCNWLVNFNAGCTVKFQDPNSYGPPFNANGGGWYAVERTNEAIKIWFWPRDSRPPLDVWLRSPVVDPLFWGVPSAYFPSTQCNLREKFARHNIIINLTLCGDWAGNTYASNGCPGDCVDLVNNHPEAFLNAYWDIAGVRIYQ